ncbi:hypothetical protein LNJ40_06850 [Tenacibaculum dicentrarchi]|uniref:hypothetical protein n=1 Tax=Tenacibaculum finnmarkense TaxID=2781243 RepID=UPI001E4BF624|nr:hypothetical protein [Tenacibaculum dicentrarchi]
MKNLLKILIITLILASCKKETKKKAEMIKSDFNLKKDYLDFKQKMTELDTLKIWVDYSACLFFGYERIIITKKLDFIKVNGEYKNETFTKDSKWKKTYDTLIPQNDTIWNFGQFLEKNKDRMTSKNKKYGRIQIKHKTDTIHLFSNGLSDLFHLLNEYDITAEKICPRHLNLTERDIEIIKDLN